MIDSARADHTLETLVRGSENQWMSQNLATHRLARALLFLGLPVSIALILRAQTPTPSPTDPARSDPVIAQLVEAHNKERAKENLPPLKLEAKLSEAALIHAKDMAEHELMGHDGSDGSTPRQRVVNAGYHFLSTGENVARGYGDVAGAMQGWMESPPHRKNILGDFSEIGAARVDGKDGKPYWCAEFGKPMPNLNPSEAASSLIKRINDERSTAKLGTLAADPRLARAAETVAADLARNKGKRSTPSAFDQIEGKFYKELAMTTSGGQPDANVLVKSLMDNPDYKAQLLGKYSRIGVGYATAEDGIPHWCVILGLPSNR
jgi:uncharacterized protein YkwD